MPSGRRLGRWGPRMVFLPRLPGPLPSNRGCGLHSPRVPFGPSGSPATGSGPRSPFEGVFLTLSTQGGGSVYAASFRGASQPGPLSESGRLGPPPPLSSTLPNSSRLLFSLGSWCKLFFPEIKIFLGNPYRRLPLPPATVVVCFRSVR